MAAPRTEGLDHTRRVLRVCEGALAREGADRKAYLDAECGEGGSVRREVDSLLAGDYESADGFLTTPPWEHPYLELPPGHRLGPYEVVGRLGIGGMGAVYEARDTRLARTVAIKVIADTAIDAAARERFTREAHAIAAINHPNICAIYDVGRAPSSTGGADPFDFLVIEYVDGGTLAARIAEGPLAVDEALQVSLQIADALAAAHRRGIVHGDLKPANVMVSSSPAGLVAKLLDFGLAELTPPTVVTDDLRTSRATAATCAPSLWMVRGTLPYVAPEQLQGRRSDPRSDLFAFGCVVYEMLTGQRAFGGSTEAHVVAAILNAEPPAPSLLQPLTPKALDRLVGRCLAKDAQTRWASARDLGDELRQILESLRPGASRSRPFRWLWGVAAGVGILTSAAAWGAWRSKPAPVQPSTLVMPIPDGVAVGGAQSLEFSPDSRSVVYHGINNGVSALYWQNLNEPDGRVIAGTESSGDRFPTPFMSPDGGWLGFVRAGALMRVPIQSGQIVLGRSATAIADGVGWMRGASWGDDGTIVYSPDPYGGLWRLSAGGGPSHELTRPDEANSGHAFPQVLPGSRAALFTIKHASGRQDRAVVAAVELNSGRVTKLIDGGSYARYAPSGHLVFARDGSLFAQLFDAASLAVRGRAVPVLGGVSMESSGGQSAKFAISNAGALVYEPALPRSTAKNSLVWVDRDSQVEEVTPEQRAYQPGLSLSSNGQRLAVRVTDPAQLESHIWTYDVVRRHWRQLTSEGDNAAPVFSPSGDRLVFSSNRNGAFNLYVTASEGGASAAERLTRSPYWQYASSWSPDGRLLIYQEEEPLRGFNTWILSIADGETRRWGPERVDAYGGKFSPDGRWIAYQSRESGRVEVYVRPFSGSGPSVRVSGANGGSAPFWSRDGRRILYVDGSRIMAATMKFGARPSVAAIHLAFVLPFVPVIAGSTNIVAATPDECRVLLTRPDPQRAHQNHRLLMIPNWTEQLKLLVPAR